MYLLENDEDFDDLLKCDGQRYDFNQISVNRVYDTTSTISDTVDTDDMAEAKVITTKVKARLKYSDPDVERKCYKTFGVTGKYAEGEPSIITYYTI